MNEHFRQVRMHELRYVLKSKLVSWLVGWVSEEVVNTMRETIRVCLQGLIRVHNACSSCVASIVLHCSGTTPPLNLEHCIREFWSM